MNKISVTIKLFLTILLLLKKKKSRISYKRTYKKGLDFSTPTTHGEHG